MKIPEPEEPEGFSLTPMIDVTFQLLIFFMLVTDLGRAQVEKLTLPWASRAEPEKRADESTLVLNIMGCECGACPAGSPCPTKRCGPTCSAGRVTILGQVIHDPAREASPVRLEALLAERRHRRDYQEVPGRTDFVKYPVLLRADRSVEFRHLQRVLSVVAKHGGVTRIQLGARKER